MTLDGCTRRRDCPHQHCEVFDMRTRTAETLCLGTAGSRSRVLVHRPGFVRSLSGETCRASLHLLLEFFG